MTDPIITIKGKAQWTTRQGIAGISPGEFNPIRGARIGLWEDDLIFDDFISGQILGKDGTFEFKIPLSRLTSDGVGGSELFVRIDANALDVDQAGNILGGFPFVVLDEQNNQEYRARFDFTLGQDFLSNPSAFGNTVDLELAIPKFRPDSSLVENNQAFAVFDAIYTGYQYLQVVSEDEINPSEDFLDIRFLVTSLSDDASYGVSTLLKNANINLNGKQVSWDVILHEFGHHLDAMDSLSDYSGADHVLFGNNIQNLGKDSGSRLAWGEGLANYLALAIQHVTYDIDSLGFPKEVPGVNSYSGSTGRPDTKFIGSKSLYDLEGASLGFNRKNWNLSGEGEELTIARILWDLADEKNQGEPFDEIQVRFNSPFANQVGHTALYKILDQEVSIDKQSQTKEPIKNLETVWEFFFTEPDYLGLPGSLSVDAKRAKLGSIFEANGVSPGIYAFNYDAFDYSFEFLDPGIWDPSITWTVGNHGANDEFEILIFDSSFSKLVFQKKLTSVERLDGVWEFKNSPRGIPLGEWKPDVDTKYGSFSFREIFQNRDNYNVVITGSDTVVDYGLFEGFKYLFESDFTGPYWSGAFAINTASPGSKVSQLNVDRNQDGIPDDQQSHVASFRQLNNTSNNSDDFITLLSSAGTSLANISLIDVSNQELPQTNEFPLEAVSFELSEFTGINPVQVDLLFPVGINADTYWNYDINQGWSEFLYDGTTGAEFQDTDGDGLNDLVVLHFVDGGRGDIDGLTNGIILHSGSPGVIKSTDMNQPPAIDTNLGLAIDEGNVATISNDLLQVTDIDNTDAEILFKVAKVPTNGNLRLSGIDLDDGSIFSQDDINNNQLTYHHSGNETLSDSFSFTVADTNDGVIDENIFEITVNPVDDAPIVNNELSPIQVNENAPNTVLDLSTLFSDVDNDDSAITKSVTSNTNETLVQTSIANNQLILDYQDNQSGSASITIQGTSNGQSIDTNLVINVVDANQAPSLNSGTLFTVDENTTFVVDLEATDDADSENSGLTYSITGGADQSVFSITSETGILSFNSTPDFETPIDASKDNIYELEATVRDSSGLSNSQILSIQVTDVDEPTDGEANLIIGTDGVDRLIGTEMDDIIIGFDRSDRLTGNGGSDQFVYTSMDDRFDRISDFEVGQDKVVLTELFENLSIPVADYTQAITQGYLDIRSYGRTGSRIRIDPDGIEGSRLGRTLLFVADVEPVELGSSMNFVL